MSIIYFIITTLTFFIVQVYSREGHCPDIQPQLEFDPAEFSKAGKWLEMYYNVEDPFKSHVDAKCTEKVFTYDDDTQSLVIETYSLSELHSHPKWYKSVVTRSDSSGIFYGIVRNDSLPFETFEIRIIDTDYLSFGVGYACAFNPHDNQHFVSLSIFTRNHHHNFAPLIQQMTMLFTAHRSPINIVAVNWEDCRAKCI